MKIYRIGRFNVGYVRRQSELIGKMIPFWPHWWVEDDEARESEIFRTKSAAMDWIRDWYADHEIEIGQAMNAALDNMARTKINGAASPSAG